MPRLKGKLLTDGDVESGAEVEVDVPDDAVLKSDVVKEKTLPRDVFKTQLDDRVESIKGTLQGELLSDDDFRERALRTWGIDPDAGDGELDDEAIAERIQRAQEQVRNDELKPLKSELEKSQERIGSLLNTRLRAEIIQAANDLGVKKAFTKAAGPDKTPPIVRQLAGVFQHDDKTDMFAVPDEGGDGFVFGSNAEPNRPYKGVREFMEEWLSDEDVAETYVGDRRQGGAGFGDPGGEGRGGKVKISREDARDHSKWKAAREAAKEQDTSVEIVD